MISILAISLALTLAVEVPVAFCWGLRRRDLLLCVLVNLLTNPAVVLLHTLFPAVWITAALEAAAGTSRAAQQRSAHSRRRVFFILVSSLQY